jgi:hypothetical protein
MKLQERFTGPYTIHQGHANGTVTIQIRENIIQCINKYSSHQAVAFYITSTLKIW